jgi:hypothetical protein
MHTDKHNLILYAMIGTIGAVSFVVTLHLANKLD